MSDLWNEPKLDWVQNFVKTESSKSQIFCKKTRMKQIKTTETDQNKSIFYVKNRKSCFSLLLGKLDRFWEYIWDLDTLKTDSKPGQN